MEREHRVLITGAGGMLGKAVYAKAIEKYGQLNVKATDIDLNEPWLSKLDVRDIREYESAIIDFKPTLVLHLAAHTDLEYCEKNTHDAWATNALGPENAALLCRKHGSVLVYISTAGIFGGEKDEYADFDTPNPLSYYAKSKYHAEQFIEKHLQEYYIFRAGWMMGGGIKKDKKFINKIYKQIQRGQTELFVVDDKLGTPTYTVDFAHALLKVIDTGYYGLYNQVCEGSGSRYEVAQEFIRLMGLEKSIKINKVSSDHFKEEYFAPRPLSEKLVNVKLNMRGINYMRHWKDALRDYAEEFREDYYLRTAPMEHYDYVVLGGGVSGLGFAKRMSDHGKRVLVLEKEAVAGGLSRTLNHNGFYLDFCAHRFHTNNKEMLAEILALPGLKMERHIKKSRIYMFGKWLKYPFEIQQLLMAMPLTQSFVSGVSFLWNQIAKRYRKTNELQSYKDWFIHLYGKSLYNVMCYPYTSKIWHHDPGEISADWADQRFQGENLKKLLARIIKKILTLDFTSYDLKDDSLAPDGGPFYYPMRGIQEMCDALLRAAEAKGARVVTGTHITEVDTKLKTVTYKHDGVIKKAFYGGLISTIPLHAFYDLQDRKHEAVERALSEIKYMDIVFVYLFINKPQISNDHWLYFPDKDIIFNRAVEFSNWSPEMCPPGKTSICFDITTFDKDKEWRMSDDELSQRTIDDAVRTGYLKLEDVDSSLVVRVKHAYPYYDLDYKRKLDIIVRHLEKDNVALLGRTGIFKYNNSDNSIEMGFALAEKFLAEDHNKSIYEYKQKASVSY